MANTLLACPDLFIYLCCPLVFYFCNIINLLVVEHISPRCFKNSRIQKFYYGPFCVYNGAPYDGNLGNLVAL